MMNHADDHGAQMTSAQACLHIIREASEWTVRTTMRRYTRLSNGFSRKMENHAVATLNYFA